MKTVVKGGDAVKTFARRDSATAELRKLGLKPADYSMFIMQTTDGRVAVNLEKAQEYLAARLRNVAIEEVPRAQNKGRTAAQAESNQVKRPSVSATIRKLILDGLDNKAVHEYMKKHFAHDEDKAHYPGWYRSQMRRDGLIERPKKEKRVKQAKQAKPTREKAVKKVRTKKVKVPKKKQVITTVRKSSSRSQANIEQTKQASIKTGGHAPTTARLSHIEVK